MPTKKSKDKRVCILVDTQTHMMPDLAREMAKRDHDLVIGNVKDGLPEELADLSAQVEATLPMRRLVEPAEAAHFVATLIDGVGTGQTAQFFAIDNGWAFQ